LAEIELRGLRKEFGSTIAVKNFDLMVPDGEFLVLVGPSGCGKTTTLRMIAGFEDPTRGDILMDGKVVNELEPREREIGMVFQSHALFPHKTVYQNIEFGLRMNKVPRAERRKQVGDVAELVRITHLLDKMPAQCSGGESQRVALARTLVTGPSTFLLDEPLSSLDAKLRRELRAECDRLHNELKKTFIYVTHDQEEAMTLADRIVVMRDGEVEQEGTPMDIYGNPSSHFVADFFGSPSMNLIDGDIAQARFDNGVISMNLPKSAAGKYAGKGTLGIRPEHIRIGGKGPVAKEKIALVEPLGKDTLLYFETTGERPLIAMVEGLMLDRYNVGDNVGLTFPADKIYLFDDAGKRI
jgi:ABC-type sugar transport system ATPase subunit